MILLIVLLATGCKPPKKSKSLSFLSFLALRLDLQSSWSRSLRPFLKCSKSTAVPRFATTASIDSNTRSISSQMRSELGVCSQVRSTERQHSDGVARLNLSGSSRGRLRVAATFQVIAVSRSENKFESRGMNSGVSPVNLPSYLSEE